MPIDRINIKNFKSIRDSGDIQIKPINVLIGANGVGKSNFISFFKMLNSISKKRLGFYVADNGYENSLLYFGRKKSKSIEGSVVFKPEGKNTNNPVVLHGAAQSIGPSSPAACPSTPRGASTRAARPTSGRAARPPAPPTRWLAHWSPSSAAPRPLTRTFCTARPAGSATGQSALPR